MLALAGTRALRASTLTAALVLGMACKPPRAPDSEASRVDEIAALPYLAAGPVNPSTRRLVGVVKNDAQKAAAGLNLLMPWGNEEAILFDNAGTPVHRWHNPKVAGTWHLGVVEGDELALVVEDVGLYRLDHDSNVLHHAPFRAHHELYPLEQGYLTLSRRIIDVDWSGNILPVLDDLLLEIDRQGKIKRQISVFDLVGEDVTKREDWKAQLQAYIANADWQENPDKQTNTSMDIFHTNALIRLEAPIEGVANTGDWLVSVLNVGVLIIVDPETKAIKWRWGDGELYRQHQPTVTRAGTFLVFDNGKTKTRLLEVDPKSKKIIWSYDGAGQHDFRIPWAGGVEELENGNLLVAASTEGWVFEITRQGEVVWSYYTPMQDAKRRRFFYRASRIPRSQYTPAPSQRATK